MAKGSDRDARAALDAALRSQRTVDELHAEAQRAQPTTLGLPTQWSNGEQTVRGHSSLAAPTGEELARYADPDRKSCGGCRYFDVHRARVEMVRQRIPERLVREEDWDLRHLGAPLEHLGICAAGDGSMLTTTMSPACDQYRVRGPKRGR
jgi:hypothetical protein